MVIEVLLEWFPELVVLLNLEVLKSFNREDLERIRAGKGLRYSDGHSSHFKVDFSVVAILLEFYIFGSRVQFFEDWI